MTRAPVDPEVVRQRYARAHRSTRPRGDATVVPRARRSSADDPLPPVSHIYSFVGRMLPPARASPRLVPPRPSTRRVLERLQWSDQELDDELEDAPARRTRAPGPTPRPRHVVATGPGSRRRVSAGARESPAAQRREAGRVQLHRGRATEHVVVHARRVAVAPEARGELARARGATRDEPVPAPRGRPRRVVRRRSLRLARRRRRASPPRAVAGDAPAVEEARRESVRVQPPPSRVEVEDAARAPAVAAAAAAAERARAKSSSHRAHDDGGRGRVLREHGAGRRRDDGRVRRHHGRERRGERLFGVGAESGGAKGVEPRRGDGPDVDGPERGTRRRAASRGGGRERAIAGAV